MQQPGVLVGIVDPAPQIGKVANCRTSHNARRAGCHELLRDNSPHSRLGERSLHFGVMNDKVIPALITAGLVTAAVFSVRVTPSWSQTPARGAATVQRLTDAPSLAAGKALFENPRNMCVTCHRPDLGGLVGPDLTDGYWLHGCGVADIMESIRTGFPDKGMVPFGGAPPMNDLQLRQIASYMLSKQGSAPAKPKARDAVRDVACK